MDNSIRALEAAATAAARAAATAVATAAATAAATAVAAAALAFAVNHLRSAESDGSGASELLSKTSLALV